MPAYNCETFVAEALESALAQSYPHIEIIVVNDGSTDTTAEQLDAFTSKGVKVITQSNLGQCAAANRAFQESSGTYIKFLDADDLIAPETIQAQLDALSDSTSHVASCRWGRFYGSNPEATAFNPEPNWKDMPPIDWLCTAFREGASMLQSGIWLVPRAVLERSGLWNEELSLINDFDFFFRVLLASEGVRFADSGKLFYRSGVAGSLSSTFSATAARSAFSSLTLGTSALIEAEDSARTRQLCADVFQRWAYSFYPDHPEFSKLAEQNAESFGGSAEPFPAGRSISTVAKLFGWRAAARMRALFYGLGWDRVAQFKASRRYGATNPL